MQTQDEPLAEPNPNESAVVKAAFDYAWGYFALHSAQRMQSVNFFLVAAAFLAGAYVSAVRERPGLAVGLSLLGALFSFIFYRMERRVRQLIQAAEAALRPIEKAMASRTNNPSLRILELVESRTRDAWHYSKVFRVLYITVGVASAIATVYAASAKLGGMPQPKDPLVMIRLSSGLILLVFAYACFCARVRNTNCTWLDTAGQLALLVAGALAAAGGGIILFRLGFFG